MEIAGIDEAGRGAVIGPLVIAGVVIKKEDLDTLRRLGVRDSKELSRKRREELYYEIKKLALDIKIVKIFPKEIDMRENVGMNLNRLELVKMADIIKNFDVKPDKIYIDMPYLNKNRFLSELKNIVGDINIIAEHKADSKYLVVGAASIIAKVERDWEIDKIKKDTGIDFGVGYPHDDKTIDFLDKAVENKELRKYIRKTWNTWQREKERKEQKTLFDF